MPTPTAHASSGSPSSALLDSLGGSSANPAFEQGEFPLSYGLVALAIFGVGFGLVEAGRRVAIRRRTRRAEAVPAWLR